MIYFFQPVSGGPVKIGHSEDVDRRRSELEVVYGLELAILATMPGGRDEERSIHDRFAHLRLGSVEQFRPAADLMAFIGRPLLVGANPKAVESMEPVASRSITHMKGSSDYSDFVDAVHRKTHIPKVQQFRLAYADWCERNGYGTPPEI